MRVDSRLNINSPSTTTRGSSTGASTVHKPLGQQVQEHLFGRRPSLFDLSSASAQQQEKLAALLEMLREIRTKIELSMDQPIGGAIVLANDTIGAIDADGTIYFGASFLLQHAQDTDLLVGVLAHEVGHRPEKWKMRHGQGVAGLPTAELQQILRQEEILADTFAGRRLAELSLSVEPLVALLRQVQTEPHPTYLLADERAEVLRQAHADASLRLAEVRKHYPEMHRARGLEHIIGEF